MVGEILGWKQNMVVFLAIPPKKHACQHAPFSATCPQLKKKTETTLFHSLFRADHLCVKRITLYNF